MSTFFQQTAQAMIAKHIDRFPLRKTGNIWKNIGCWTALCAKPTATVR